MLHSLFFSVSKQNHKENVVFFFLFLFLKPKSKNANVNLKSSVQFLSSVIQIWT